MTEIDVDDALQPYYAIRSTLLVVLGVAFLVYFVLNWSRISLRRKATKALRKSEERKNQILNSALDAFVVMDARGLITDWNPQAASIFGWTREEAMGRNLADTIMPSRYRQAHRKGLCRFLETGESRLLRKPTEITALHRDGREFPVELNIALLRVNEQYVFSAFIKDITGRKQAEEERQRLYNELKETYQQLEKQSAVLAQTEKMTAVGTMAAGVAHELNNPMMGILNFAQYCKKKTDKEDKRYSVLEDIEHEAIRCTDIVTNLLTFSHAGIGDNEDYRRQKCDVILERVKKLLSYRIEKNNISLDFELDENIPPIWVKENKIQEVFLNLFTNALDAVEKSEKKK